MLVSDQGQSFFHRAIHSALEKQNDIFWIQQHVPVTHEPPKNLYTRTSNT